MFRSVSLSTLLSLLLLLAVAVSAQETTPPPAAPPSWRLQVRAEREAAIYKKGETALFHVRLFEKNGDAETLLAGKELWYHIQGDGFYEKKGTVTSADPFAVVEVLMEQPGFVKCTVGWNDVPDGKKISALGGAGFDPLEIRAQTPEPEDFDAFWNAKKEALAALPMNPRLVPVDAEKVNNPKVLVFDVKVDCLGGKPLSGYLAKPADAAPKSLPILVSYHGAGVRSASMPIGDANRGVLALDINAHGIENGQPAEFYNELAGGELKDYRLAGADNLDNLYFVGMYLRVIRSLQFMKAQPEWDGKTIIVRGGSQGGGQALVAAGVDSDVTFCVAYVPALCYPTGDIEGRFGGWPGFLRGKTAETADATVVKTVSYIDAAHFAKRIKAESILSTGFVDYTCSPTSVYVAYNNIKAPKQIITTPDANHSIPGTTYEIANRLLWDYVKRNRVALEKPAE